MPPASNAKLLRIHISEGDTYQGKPLYEAIVAKCREMGIAGATVYRGFEGFGLSAHIHHSSLWPGANDPPIMVSIVDREERIALLLPHLDEMVAEGIVAISDVEVIRYTDLTRSDR